MIDHRVAVCRDHAKDACKRQQCKYYHIPIAVPPAHVMANLYKRDSTTAPLTAFTSTILQTSADALNNRNSMEHCISTTTTTVTESPLNERHAPLIRSHRSATQTHWNENQRQQQQPTFLTLHFNLLPYTVLSNLEYVEHPQRTEHFNFFTSMLFKAKATYFMWNSEKKNTHTHKFKGNKFQFHS